MNKKVETNSFLPLTLDGEGRSDENLVSLTLENQGYFLHLMKRYEKQLIVYIKRISGFRQEDAEDILQEVFIKVYQNLNNFDSSLKFSSWIYRIAHNHVISTYRKIKVRPETIEAEIEEGTLERIVSNLDLEKDIDLKYLRENINKIFSKINVKYREVLILKYFEEKDYQEMSDILKKPVGTIGTLVNRGKNKFRDELSDNQLL